MPRAQRKNSSWRPLPPSRPLREVLSSDVVGRTAELQRTIEVLCRRRKNNPVFVGDPGVGKTALAEGLATRLLHDDVQGALAEARHPQS